MRLWLVLPIYNERANLPDLFSKLQKTEQDTGVEMIIVAVDDGSSDGTADVLDALSASHQIHTLKHRRNRGLGETIRDGFEYAADNALSGDVIARMDSDNTHDPVYIKALLEAIEGGADVAIASRFPKGGGQVGVASDRSIISALANIYFRTVFPLGGVREYTCGYRAYRADILKRALDLYGNRFIQLSGLGFCCTVEKLVKLRLLGAKIVEVPFTLRYDLKQGVSKMAFNITTFGYLVMAVLYHWPWGGWRSSAKKLRPR